MIPLIRLRSASSRRFAWARLFAAFLAAALPARGVEPEAGAERRAGRIAHVAPDGSDDRSGESRESAWRTLAAAAARLEPGDVCLIHDGMYRETLAPPGDGEPDAPIVFRAARRGGAVLSGLDPVGPWERVDARTFRARLGWDLEAGNQVFRDGRPLTEARWPNRVNDDPFDAGGARAEYEGSDYDRIRCLEFPEGWTAEALAGATVWCMAQSRWSSWTAPVTGYDPETRTLRVRGHDNWWVRTRHNPGTPPPPGRSPPPFGPAEFYISNARILLDAPGEWFHDADTGYLYLAVEEGDDPNDSLIEARRRPVAVDLSDRAHIHVEDLSVFGATLVLRGSRHCRIARLTARHIAHTRGGHTRAHFPGMEGIHVTGSGNVIRDSEISHSTVSGVTMGGTDNSLINCLVHATGTIGAYAVSVRLDGARHLVSHNTLRDSGRDIMQFRGVGHLIQFNDISGAGRICFDTGALYQGGSDGGGTRIRYNWVHNVHTHWGNGIYLDNYTQNFLVYRNVVWDVSGNAIQLNHPGRYNMVFHNTIFGRVAGTYSPWRGRLTFFGTRLANNLVSGESRIKPDSGVVEVATVLHGLDEPGSGFDPRGARYDAGADRGVPLPGINDGHSGAAPDCGAYEAGQPRWRAGHDFDNPPDPVYEPLASFHRNYLANGSFSDAPGGVPAGWTPVAGECAVKHFEGFNSPPADGRFSVHGNSLVLGGAAAAEVEQSLEGLRPGAEFVFTAYVRAEGARDVALIVRTPRGELAAARHSEARDDVWRHVEAAFRAPADGPVTVAIRKEGSGEAYVDDAGVVPVWQGSADSGAGTPGAHGIPDRKP